MTKQDAVAGEAKADKVEKDPTVLDLSAVGIEGSAKLGGKIMEIELSEFPKNIGPPPSAEMIASVKTLGVLHPVVVKVGDKGYVIIDGIRRVLAARAAGNIKTIKARVVEVDDTLASVITMVSNHHRSNNPHAEGKALLALVGKDENEENEAVKRIARSIGIDSRKATGILGVYRSLSQTAKTALRSGQLPSHLARRFSLLSESAQAKLLEGGEITEASIKGQKSRARREKKANALVTTLRRAAQIAERDGYVALTRTLSEMADEVDKAPRPEKPKAEKPKAEKSKKSGSEK